MVIQSVGQSVCQSVKQLVENSVGKNFLEFCSNLVEKFSVDLTTFLDLAMLQPRSSNVNFKLVLG